MNICKVYGCNYKTRHITKEHICGYCGCKGHGKLECGNDLAINFLLEYNDYDTFNNIKHIVDNIDIKTIILNLYEGEYTSIYAGLGSQLFVRKVYRDRCQFLFMHQDDWGQYDIETSRKPKYDKFIYGYKEIKL